MSGPGAWAVFEDKAEYAGFAQIPNALLRCPRISLGAKSVYCLLKSYAWQDSSTFPGIKTLCEAAGVSKDTLGKYLKELVAVGLIEVKRRGQGKTNLYTFKSISKFLESDRPSGPDGDTGSHQDGDTGPHNEDSVNEDSVSSLSNESASDSSAASAQAKAQRHIAKNNNWFAKFCEQMETCGLAISPEDRKLVPSNLLRCQAKEGATDAEMYKVIMKMVMRRDQGVVLSPQRALNDVRGIPVSGNGYKKKSYEYEMPYSPVI